MTMEGHLDFNPHHVMVNADEEEDEMDDNLIPVGEDQPWIANPTIVEELFTHANNHEGLVHFWTQQMTYHNLTAGSLLILKISSPHFTVKLLQLFLERMNVFDINHVNSQVYDEGYIFRPVTVLMELCQSVQMDYEAAYLNNARYLLSEAHVDVNAGMVGRLQYVFHIA